MYHLNKKHVLLAVLLTSCVVVKLSANIPFLKDFFLVLTPQTLRHYRKLITTQTRTMAQKICKILSMNETRKYTQHMLLFSLESKPEVGRAGILWKPQWFNVVGLGWEISGCWVGATTVFQHFILSFSSLRSSIVVQAPLCHPKKYDFFSSFEWDNFCFKLRFNLCFGEVALWPCLLI